MSDSNHEAYNELLISRLIKKDNNSFKINDKGLVSEDIQVRAVLYNENSINIIEDPSDKAIHTHEMMWKI